jgi:flagellar hook protein FlgE
MGFDIAISGLTASRQMLDVTGNNIANANTTGFKVSRVLTEDVYPAGNGGATAIGLGTRTAEIQQQFNQGSIQSTGNSLDLSISGQGFFTMARSKDNLLEREYTRAGAFHMDKEGYVINSAGRYLLGNDSSGTPSKIQIQDVGGVPQPTSTVINTLNLDARSPVVTATSINPSDPSTYSYNASMLVYDSQGDSHTLTAYYVKTAPNTWSMSLYSPSPTSVNDKPLGDPIALEFDTKGRLKDQTTTQAIKVTIPGGAVDDINISANFSGLTQYSSEFSVNNQYQDGYPKGILTGVMVSDNGEITAKYSNGQNTLMSTLLLTRFNNPNGLEKLGANAWATTGDSGPLLTNLPRTSGLGSVQASSLESSNVDLSTELVKLIVAQQSYQANSQSISTLNQSMQSILNIR